MAGIVRANNIFAVSGPNVSYTGGEIDVQSPDPIAPTAWFFGTPVISGLNDLNFTSDISSTPKPINFRVITPGFERLEDGTLAVNVATTNPLGSIALMSIVEGGDYLIQNATAASTAAAVLNITSVKITSINGLAVNTISLVPAEIAESFSHPSGVGPAIINSNSILFSGAGPLVTGTWQADASFNLTAALNRTGHNGQRVTGLQIVLDDIISGTAEANALVEITKKDFLLSVSSNPVPEPASIVMGVLGSLSLAVVGLRKKFAKVA
jgi:hypothetical protein